jgi:hypothetical protein
VGVVDADLGLAGGDLRAGERTYQTLVQAAGRAGAPTSRAERCSRPGTRTMKRCGRWKRATATPS